MVFGKPSLDMSPLATPSLPTALLKTTVRERVTLLFWESHLKSSSTFTWWSFCSRRRGWEGPQWCCQGVSSSPGILYLVLYCFKIASLVLHCCKIAHLSYCTALQNCFSPHSGPKLRRQWGREFSREDQRMQRQGTWYRGVLYFWSWGVCLICPMGCLNVIKLPHKTQCGDSSNRFEFNCMSESQIVVLKIDNQLADWPIVDHEGESAEVHVEEHEDGVWHLGRNLNIYSNH